MVVFVSNKESAIWKDSGVKELLRHVHLKYIDVEGKGVVTSDRCVAEQIKGDKVEDVATGGARNGDFGKVGKCEISRAS